MLNDMLSVVELCELTPFFASFRCLDLDLFFVPVLWRLSGLVDGALW